MQYLNQHVWTCEDTAKCSKVTCCRPADDMRIGQNWGNVYIGIVDFRTAENPMCFKLLLISIVSEALKAPMKTSDIVRPCEFCRHKDTAYPFP